MKFLFIILFLSSLAFNFDNNSYIRTNRPGTLKFSIYPNIGDDKDSVVNVLGNPNNVINTRQGVAWTWGADDVGGTIEFDEYWNNQVQVDFSAGVVTNIRITSFYIINNPIKSDRLALPKVKEVLPPWAKKKHIFILKDKQEDIQQALFLAAENGVMVLSCQAQSVDYINSNPPAVKPIEDPLKWRVYSISFHAYDGKDIMTLDKATSLR